MEGASLWENLPTKMHCSARHAQDKESCNGWCMVLGKVSAKRHVHKSHNAGTIWKMGSWMKMIRDPLPQTLQLGITKTPAPFPGPLFIALNQECVCMFICSVRSLTSQVCAQTRCALWAWANLTETNGKTHTSFNGEGPDVCVIAAPNLKLGLTVSVPPFSLECPRLELYHWSKDTRCC